MKKYLLIVLVLFTGCATLFNPYRGMIDRTSRCYYSDSLQFGFPLPTSWNLIRLSNDSSETIFFPKIRTFATLVAMTNSNHRAAVRVIVSVSTQLSLMSFLQSLRTAIPEYGYFLTGAYWIPHDHDSAVVVEYRRNGSRGKPNLLREFCFMQRGHLVRIQCASLAITFADYEPFFSDIISNSFFDVAEVPSGQSGGGRQRWSSCSIAAADCPIDIIPAASVPPSVVTYDALCIDSTLSTCWMVTSPRTSVYILGSVHVAKPEIYPLKPAINAAFAESEVLVVEVNTHKTDMQQAMHKFVSKIQYADGGTISAYLSDSLNRKLKVTCNNLGMPYATYAHFQPWMLSMSLSMAQLQKLGITGEYGIDDYFLAKAEQRHMEIGELETAESQLNLLYESCNVPSFLEYTLSDLDRMEQYIVPLIGAWKCGNTAMLEAMTYTPEMVGHPEYGPYLDKLLFKRNRDFVTKIEGYLKDHRRYFIVFGSGHAVGEQGVIKMLERKGYTVRQL